MLHNSYRHPPFRLMKKTMIMTTILAQHALRRVCCMVRSRSLRRSLILPARCSETSLLVCSDARWACLLRRQAGGQSTPRSTTTKSSSTTAGLCGWQRPAATWTLLS